jgi:hypothetical protein
MKTKVYIETSVVSYLTSVPSRDIVVAAHQQVTRDWWGRREQFDLFVSEAVLEEAAAGDPEAAAKRTAALEGTSAVHVATAAVNELQVLLTWNCAHLANPANRVKIEEVCRHAGWTPPVVCTPLGIGGS